MSNHSLLCSFYVTKFIGENSCFIFHVKENSNNLYNVTGEFEDFNANCESFAFFEVICGVVFAKSIFTCDYITCFVSLWTPEVATLVCIVCVHSWEEGTLPIWDMVTLVKKCALVSNVMVEAGLEPL